MAVGDLHGDLGRTRLALQVAGAIDEQSHWIGGALTLVQTGDQLDRGDDDRQLLRFLDALRAEAEHAGGHVHLLNGNHELMNVAGNFAYVTQQGLADFSDIPAQRLGPLAQRLPVRFQGRAAAFFPGGTWARELASHLGIVQVGDTVFVHAGLLPYQVDYGIGRINSEVSAWMAGELPQLPPQLGDANGPFWLRTYGAPEVSDGDCQTLGRVLEALAAHRMVVGHTVQTRGINAACQARVWRIDVGLSSAVAAGPLEVLEIRGARVNVLNGRDLRARSPRRAPEPSPQ